MRAEEVARDVDGLQKEKRRVILEKEAHLEELHASPSSSVRACVQHVNTCKQQQDASLTNLAELVLWDHPPPHVNGVPVIRCDGHQQVSASLAFIRVVGVARESAGDDTANTKKAGTNTNDCKAQQFIFTFWNQG